jgi:hypothetical protein
LVEHKLIPKLMTILNRILDYYAQITSKMSWFNVRCVVLKMTQEKFEFPGCFQFPTLSREIRISARSSYALSLCVHVCWHFTILL